MTVQAFFRRLPQIDPSLLLIAGAVLGVCIFYGLAYVLVAPYSGLEHDSRWVVLQLDQSCEQAPEWCKAVKGTLQVGDQMISIGSLTYNQYRQGRLGVPFGGYLPGDLVPVTFIRGGNVLQTDWPLLGPVSGKPAVRLGLVIPCLLFWLVGSGVLLFLRPRDGRWVLLIAFNYLLGVWWAVGAGSSTQIAGSSLAVRAVTWLLVPVSLELHAALPTTLYRPAAWLKSLAYGTAGLLALAELFRLLPPPTYYFGLMLALGGSLLLLVFRWRTSEQPQVRLATRFLLVGIMLSAVPGIVLWVVPGLLGQQGPSVYVIYLPTLAFVLLPVTYTYTIYKHRLGALELRANRFLTLYSFMLLYTTAFALVFAFANQWLEFSASTLAFAIIVSSAFVALALPLSRVYQRFISRIAYGTVHDLEDALRTFTREIPRALSQPALVRLLTQEVAPSLLIRKSALYVSPEAEPRLLYADGIVLPEGNIAAAPLSKLMSEAGRYRPIEAESQDPWEWVRLAIPVEVGGKNIGLWLFGERDPEDFYPQADVDLLETLGNQVGVALENSRLIDSLQRRAVELETAYRQLQKLDKLKDEFVQNVSHELRTPLTFIQGYSELMRDGAFGSLSQPQGDAIEAVLDRTQRIIKLVNDIISVQQAANDRMEMEPVHIPSLAHSCIETAHIVAKKIGGEGRSFRFDLEIAEDLPQVLGDRRQLSQAVENLLENAIKFSPEGGTISLRVRRSMYPLPPDEPDATMRPVVEIEVRDTGIGMPDEVVGRIFDRFYQVDGSRTRRYGGMGLGLSIVRGIIAAHGGKVWAESEAGSGSTFYVILPALETGSASVTQTPVQATV